MSMERGVPARLGLQDDQASATRQDKLTPQRGFRTAASVERTRREGSSSSARLELQ